MSTARSTSRGVSPVIGLVLIFALTVVIGGGAIFISAEVITDEQPREVTNFVAEFDNAGNTTEFNLIYDEGEPFNSQNTDGLYLIGENSSGEDIGPIHMYQNGAHTATQTAEIDTGDAALTHAQINDTNIDPRSTIEVVWVTDSQTETEYIIERITLPSEETIADLVLEGAIEEGKIEGSVTVEGDSPFDDDD